MLFFCYFLAFRLHSLKELHDRQKVNKNTKVIRKASTQIKDLNKIPKISDSKDPLCGTYSYNLKYNTIFVGYRSGDGINYEPSEKFHYCSEERDGFVTCNEYSKVAVASCY